VAGLSWRIGATSFIGVVPCSEVAAGAGVESPETISRSHNPRKMN
jgi:hypothetical protein